MVVVHRDLKGVKPSGGRYKQSRVKRKFEKGSLPTLTAIGSKIVRSSKSKGGGRKLKLVSSEVVNVFDGKSKSFIKAKLIRVVDSAANHNFVRGNIVTKGAIVETDKGNVRVTNRPGQDGVVNGVLV